MGAGQGEAELRMAFWGETPGGDGSDAGAWAHAGDGDCWARGHV